MMPNLINSQFFLIRPDSFWHSHLEACTLMEKKRPEQTFLTNL